MDVNRDVVFEGIESMASSSDNDDSSSSDDGIDAVFYDANESLNTSDTASSLQDQPRWRLSSKNESVKRTENVVTITLTEKQLHDIERRDKLQRLRGHENPKIEIKLPSSSQIEQESSSASALTDHIDPAQKRRSDPPISNEILSTEYLAPYPTLPLRSTRSTSDRRTVSVSSENTTIDLTTIDYLTKYGEMTPNSGKLNDDEILRQPILRNLDSGKYVPLSDANPMTQTIMERVHGSMLSLRPTSIFNSNLNSSETQHLSTSDLSLSRQQQFDTSSSGSSSTRSSQTTAESISSAPSPSLKSSGHGSSSTGKKQLAKMVVMNFLRRRKKANDPHTDRRDVDDEEDDNERLLINDGSNGDLKYKASRHLKEPTQFDKTQLLQTIVNAHEGPIWCMKFSPDGHLLATGGQDSLLKVWVLKSTQLHFQDFSRLTSNSQNEILTNRFHEFHQQMLSETFSPTINAQLGLKEIQGPFFAKPFCELIGHQAPVLDVAWSKSLFLLSSSMDKTVRLWHLSRLECLCFFRHVDFVSAIAFHPRDDRYFVSASLDGHVRLWNIPDKRVVHWSLIPTLASSHIPVAEANLITAVNFCDDGRKVTVGTFDGRFLLYTDSLQYDTVMNIGEKDGSRSHRSRKKRRKPYKITGIDSMNLNNSKVLITSNDSRIRLYDIRSKEIERKYRGYSNQSSQIRASFSHDDRYIISGSEDSWFYIWRTEPTNSASVTEKLIRKQRRYAARAYERIRVHNTMVTSAIFAPNPVGIMNCLHSSINSSPSTARFTFPNSTPNVNNRVHSGPIDTLASNSHDGSIYVMVTADSKGQLKLLVNRYLR